jgi:hypothetical protein
MMQSSLAAEDLLEGEDALEEVDEFEQDAFAEQDAFSEVDELGERDALDDVEALDEFEEADALADEFEEELSAEDEGDALDDFGDFALDSATGLYTPAPPRLISGPAAVAIAQRLNPVVLQSMDADDADAFFRRIGRGLRRIGRGIGRAARGVGRVVGRVARVAAPILRRVLPIVQRVAGLAGPWGRLVSAGLGAVRGLAEGRGLRGALAGAVGGLVPGVGGRLAGAVLRFGDGADDDAALDALADMSDAGQVPAGVALPLGAGLATRIATPRIAGNIPPPIARRAAVAERTMMRAANAAGGSTGRRLRILRIIACLVRSRLRRRGSAGRAAAALPATTQAVARQVLRRARQRPSMGASSPAGAARRVMARRQILARVPIAAAYRGRRVVRGVRN